MSHYTMQLRELISNNIDLGLQKYPIWNENYRAVLNEKIIEHYYMREIGCETPYLFVRWLNRKMNEIMPYYNQLYESAEIEYDPLVNNITTIHHVKNNTDEYTDKHEGEANTVNDGTYTRDRDETDHETWSETSDQKDHSESNTFTETRGINSDTPQQQIGLKGIVFDALYATNASTSQEEGAAVTDTTSHRDASGERDTAIKEAIDDTSHSTQDYDDSWTNTHTGKAWEDFVQTNDGLNNASQPDLILQYRETMLNIDMMVIEELAPLFMLLYD